MNKRRVTSEKLSISLPKEMAEWLRGYSKKKMSTISEIIKQMLMPHYEGEKNITDSAALRAAGRAKYESKSCNKKAC